MPPRRRPAPGPTAEWMARARGDLALASAPRPAGVLREDLALHAQQASEKALKAVFVHIGQPFRYTHDLDELVLGLIGQGISVPPNVQACVPLTAYATATRYPGSGVVVGEEQLREALEIATAVVEWAASVIEGTVRGPA
jgi:HEPN domain-containing protein